MQSILKSRKKFTPLPVTFAKGITLDQPMATGRATPSKKTPGKIMNGCCQTPQANGG